MKMIEVIRTDQILKIAIEHLKKIAASKKRKFKLRKVPKIKDIRPIQRAYIRELNNLINHLGNSIDEMVTQNLSNIIAEAEINKPKSDSLNQKNDDVISTITRAMSAARLMFIREYDENEIAFMAKKQADRVNSYNETELKKMFGSVLGIDLILAEPYLKQTLETFVKSNVSLITSISENHFSRVEQSILRNTQAGVPLKNIKEEIQKTFNVSKSRASLIARDQTAKLNSNLNQLRQTEAGIKKYRWSTSGDERVRDSHIAKDGNIYSWDNPPSDTGNPGEDFQCIPSGSIVEIHAPAKKAFRRWYDGKLTELVVSSNEPLRTTPNHPVLTQRGWVPAKLVEIGDYLIEAPDKNINSFIEYPQGRNIQSQEMFGAFKRLGLFHRVATIASGFHGDAIDKKIDIVEINRSLFLNNKPFTSKKFSKEDFSFTFESAFRQSDFSFGGVAFRDALRCFMRSSSEIHSILSGSFSHAIEHCIASVANGNIVINQNTSDCSSTNFELFSDKFLANAIIVKPNNFKFRKVNKIVRSSFSGWVHNFETLTGWYSSSNLIVHNCRCQAIPIFEDI